MFCVLKLKNSYTFDPTSSTIAMTTLLLRSGLSLGHTCFNILLSIAKPSEEDKPFRLFAVTFAPPCCCRLLTKRSPGYKHKKEMSNSLLKVNSSEILCSTGQGCLLLLISGFYNELTKGSVYRLCCYSHWMG